MGLDNLFKKKAQQPRERMEPPPLQAPGAEAASSNKPEEQKETLEQEAEREFNKIAADGRMSPDDLRSLERVQLEDPLLGRNSPKRLDRIKGTVNGVHIDVGEIYNDAIKGVE